jgi:hypothetical protein
VIEHRLCVRVGGLCFELASTDVPILHEVTEPYRSFVSRGSAVPGADAVRVRVSVGDVKPCGGDALFDGGSWRLLARGSERAFVFQTRLMSEPLYEARFRPGSREVELICSPGLVESVDGVTCIRSHFRYPLDQVLAMYFLGDAGVVLHAAGVVRDGRSVVFAGVSGAGKTTVTRLAERWRGAFPLNDDRLILHVGGDGVVAHGTPWPGEGAVAENRGAETGVLLFLEQGAENRVRRTVNRETLARLLPVVSLPWFDTQHLDAGLRACDAIIRRLPAGVLTFRPEAAALDAVDEFLRTLG